MFQTVGEMIRAGDPRKPLPFARRPRESLNLLLENMRMLERENVRELQGRETEFLYEMRQRKVRFTEEARARSRPLVKRLTGHIHESRFVMKSMHSRYRTFFDYGDAEHYRKQIETVRRSFEDVETDKAP